MLFSSEAQGFGLHNLTPLPYINLSTPPGDVLSNFVYFSIFYSVSLIMLPLPDTFSLNQMKHFSHVKFAMGYELSCDSKISISLKKKVKKQSSLGWRLWCLIWKNASIGTGYFLSEWVGDHVLSSGYVESSWCCLPSKLCCYKLLWLLDSENKQKKTNKQK